MDSRLGLVAIMLCMVMTHSQGRTNLDTRAWRTGRLVIGVFDDEKAGGPIDFISVTGPAI